MSFQKMLEEDLSKVFFNINEFATEHELEGQVIPLILDEDKIQERKLKAAEGTYLGEVLIFVDKQYLSYRPVEDQRISFDNKHYFVVSCNDDGCMYEIVLGANESW